ncbi:hypothetical protein [Xenorhabdus hominickii]|uniref:Uncharacterized protein n=1 Tax=Xenorhabdus hominickii TaxID=351679 RepID=A0A2G0PZ41_XENHO|nr:hypothetical protein [Xenorhabdus hominickii]AOM42601.1 hypothetical protein A9255_19860 [Xenorhabdus hominickii]PHM52237.1 hypothetical protein Xhom_04617 [Xenorhabdus hominickii]PHM53955.1 hypothetical protein Xhom_03023 [Xenorhabdus hominickii]
MNNKLQAAVEIAEEIEASIFPVVSATQNEAELDAYLMCRGVHRQTCDLAQRLRDINKEYITSDNQAFDELEGVASEIESLRTYVSLLMDTDKSLSGAQLLSIALAAVFNIGKEIARVRGVEYS